MTPQTAVRELMPSSQKHPSRTKTRLTRQWPAPAFLIWLRIAAISSL